MHGKMQPAKIVLFNYSGVVICFSEKCPQAKTTMYTRRVNGYNHSLYVRLFQLL